MKTSVVRARIPKELKKDFDAIVSTHQLSLSHVMRMLMTKYVDEEKKKARRLEETLEAMEDIEAGRVVHGDNVMSWLAGWGTDAEDEPPL